MTVNNATNSAKSAASSAMSAAGSAVNSAMSATGSAVSTVAKPLAEPSRNAYGRFQEGVQRYVEKWEDLVHEAKVESGHDEDSVTADSVLKGLSDAKVTCDFPGRLRLQPAGLKGHSSLAEPIAQVLGSIPGVKQVDVSSLTGSILMIYDKKKYATGKDLLAAIPTA